MSLKKTKHKILFYGLGTKEDLDSLYIQHLTSFELMKSGPSSENYCDKDLVIKVAKKFDVDYVWPGWGFLSENSMFSKQLENNSIGFIGPNENAMHMLGDKWKSTEACIALGIPTIPSINIVRKDSKTSCEKEIFDCKKYGAILNKLVSEISLRDKYVLYKQYKGLCDKKRKEIKKILCITDKNNDLLKTIKSIKIDKQSFEFVIDTFKVLQKYHKPDIYEKQEKTIDFAEIAKDKTTGYANLCTPKSDENKSAQKYTKNQGNYNREHIDDFISLYSFPLLLKTANSGGGKGIREIFNSSELYSALDTVENEGIGDIMICKSIQNARHIELQMASDNYGNIICLGGRDCTLQRRNQKLLEECIEASKCKFYVLLEESAYKLMKSVQYTGVATVEFLVTADSFYFLEVNTRIQVEHPVTELKYNVNIPELQFLIATGQSIKKYKYKQSKKHVIGVRIVAENVKENFLPVTGMFSVTLPCFSGCFGYFAKARGKITEYNDSQFGHVFVKSKTRSRAAKKMINYLQNINLTGIHTNINFMIDVLQSKFFITNEYNIRTIENILSNKDKWFTNEHVHVDSIIIFATIMALETSKCFDNVNFLYSETTYTINFYKAANDTLFLEMNHTICKVKYILQKHVCYVFYNNICDKINYELKYDCVCVNTKTGIHNFYLNYQNTNMTTPTDGKIIRFFVQNMQQIKKDEDLVEIEIMKMRITIKSKYEGLFVKVKEENSFVKSGDIIANVIKNKEVKYKENRQGFPNKHVYKPTNFETYLTNFFNGFDLPNIFFDEFDKISKFDINMLIRIFRSYDNENENNERKQKFFRLLINKIQENLVDIENVNVDLPLIEILQCIDNFILILQADKETFTLLVKLKIFFSEYKFKKLNFSYAKTVTDLEFTNYLQKSCNYKEGILFAIKNVNVNKKILIKNYLENHLGKIYTDYNIYDVNDGVCFLHKDFKCLFYICSTNCLIKDSYDLVLHYNCVNKHNTEHLYFDIHNESPFVTYFYKNKTYLCDTIISKIIANQLVDNKNLIYKDMFRNLCIYKNDDYFDIEYKIDTHSGNSILDVKNISHAIKQILCSIIIMYKKHNVNKSKFAITVEGTIKIENEIVNQICDDLIFYYSKDYVKNGVLECIIIYKNDAVNKIVYNKYKGFLEKIVYKNEKPIKYYIEDKLVLQEAEINTFMSINNDKHAFKNETAITSNFLEKHNKSQALARRQNSITIDNFIELIYLHSLNMKKWYTIQERFLIKNEKTCEEENGILVQNNWYKISNGEGLKIGMRGFLIKYDSMQFIVIMNDISVYNGSFSMEEDIFYTLMIREASTDNMPFVNISCNSGARIGLYDDVKQNIVLTKEGYFIKQIGGILQNQGTGDVCSKTVSVYGNETTGSENLSYSGLIAKETCFAYNKTLVISYVTGISVGIGAYVNKLGQRIIQKHDSAIILTGFQAINTLLQTSKYKNNCEIGGKEIMTKNGNSHLIVQNDYEGVCEIIAWIDYFYNSRTKKYKSTDKSSKKIDCVKEHDKTSYFLQMYENTKVKDENQAENEIIERIIDQNTFKEYKKEYAKNILIGRGKINGISIGIISSYSETEKTCKNVLNVEASNKIAQSISDFDKEGLDILILANYKGFSGDQEEMKNNILREGSLIVEKLAVCRTKVLIYVVPHGEVRGGSWVVFDKKINPNIKIAAHPYSEIGILQPDALSKLKFTEKEREDIFKKYNTEYSTEKGHKLATSICKLHDSCYRLYLKGHIDDVVSVEELKTYIYNNILT
ncbi:acetyl-coenzyme-A carboxylase [Binucleata daphniae]